MTLPHHGNHDFTLRCSIRGTERLQYLCNTNNDRLSRAEGARSYTIYTGVCLKHLEMLIVLVVIVDFFAPAALITYWNLRILGIRSFFLKFLTSEKSCLSS